MMQGRGVQVVAGALLLACALAAAPVHRLVVGGPSRARAAEPAPAAERKKVLVVKPYRDTVQRSVRLSGDLKAWREARVYARASGEVLPDPVEIGTRVDPAGTAGAEVLAQLAVPDLEAALATAESRVKRTEAALGEHRGALAKAKAEVLGTEARRRQATGAVEAAQALVARAEAETAYRQVLHDRVVQVRERSPDVIAQEKVDEAIGTLAMARASVEVARAGVRGAQDAVGVADAEVGAAVARVQAVEAALAAAQADEALARSIVREAEAVRGFATVRAPFVGVVAERWVDIGDLARDASRNSGAMPLFRVVDDRRLRVQFFVADTDAGSCLCGNKVMIEVDTLPGREFQATVARSAEALDPKTRTMEVEAELENPPGEGGRPLLKPDMFVRVRVELEGYPGSLVVPARAVTTQKRKSSVMVVRPDGSVAKVSIRIGVDDGRRIQVLEGLKEDDLVITRGAQQVAAGEKVDVEIEKGGA